MSFFGSMMGSMAGRAAAPLMGVAGIGAYQSGMLDNMPIPGMAQAPSHYEMQARITGVEQGCRLRYRADGKLRQTQAMQCFRAIEMMKKPEFVGYTIHKTERVTYSYYSMDGKSTMTGTMPSAKNANGGLYRKNDVITIRVNSNDPSKSEVI